MADKSIGELIEATQILGSDLFLLQQSGNAKKLPGQTLINWLLHQLDGHGGIHGISKSGTAGLVDTYTITFADQSTSTFAVTNGRGIKSFAKVGTSGLNVTWRMTYNDGTTTDVVITNGAKGDKGDNAYVHIKWASQMPTASSHSMGDIPDDYIGIYSGNLASAPTDWSLYKWFKYRGEQGIPGTPATITAQSVQYQASENGMVTPTGVWSDSIPNVPQGHFLWTRTIVEYNTGDPVISYSAARNGIDGAGSVSSVNGQSPDAAGNVTINASQVGAISTEYFVTNDNLLDNWNFLRPVNQRGVTGTIRTPGYFIDRWKLVSGTVQLTAAGLLLNGSIEQVLEYAPGVDVTASVLTATGIMDGQYNASSRTFTIAASGETLIAAKLEIGSMQTLAHQSGGRLGINEIPDFGEQLARCQRYFCMCKGYLPVAYGGIFTATEARVTIPAPVPMRGNPSFSADDISKIEIYTVGATKNVAGIIDCSTVGASCVGIRFSGDFSGIVERSPCVLRFNTNVSLSSDL